MNWSINMRKHLLILSTFFMFIVTLLINNRIKYYGLISLFLILPYFIHTVNLAIHKKLAAREDFLGQEAQRQLKWFSSSSYKRLLLVLTILLGVALFITYLFLVFVSSKSFELYNILLLSISGAILMVFLWQFYLEMRK